MNNNLSLISKLRSSKTIKWLSVKLSLIMLFEMCYYQTGYAVTSGPGQPEFSGFQQFDNSEMVDLYSGNFKYNIPLLTVPGPNGGYPINLSYSSGTGMDEEASWVGLGWSLNVGAITRGLRGMPDDFKGDKIEQEMNIKTSRTYSIDCPGSSIKSEKKELFGGPILSESPNSAGWSGQIYYNNFKGAGIRVIVSGSQKFGKGNFFSTGLNVSLDSQNGIGLEPDFGIASKNGEAEATANIGASYNTRGGLQQFSFSTKVSGSGSYENEKGSVTGGWGANNSSSISFGVNQDFPTVSIPMKTKVNQIDVSVGSANLLGSYKTSFPKYWSGYIVKSEVANGGIINTKAYGYIYNQDASEKDLKDVNRKKISYSKKVPFLPSTSFTYDLYTISGQGTGGMFRPYRTEVTLLNTAGIENESQTRRKNGEAGGGVGSGFGHIGVGYTNGTSTQYSGKWQSGTSSLESALNNYNKNSVDFEPYYFQEYGEKISETEASNQLNDWGNDKAVRVNLDKTGGWNDREFIASSDFKTSAFSPKQAISSPAKDTRQRRGKVIQSLSVEQVKKYGFSKAVKYLDATASEASCKEKISDTHPAHHINEINVIEKDGMRYTYGLPVYNKEHTDVNMSVNASGKSGDLVTVNSSSHLGTDNEYLSKTKIPEYVHSWLLTSVVSSDYVDVTNNGVSDDDLGYWVKFHYEKMYNDYTWRTPYEKALFQEGTSSEGDNSASFSRGKKEIYVLKTIETKTHIAVFTTSNREDGLEANSSDLYAPSPTPSGGKKLKKLDKISLYAKHNLNGQFCNYYQFSTNSDPIQQVHFKYSYELCGGVPNNTGTSIDEDGNTPGSKPNINANEGKLTLKRLYNTFLNSNKGEWGQYEFDYGNLSDQYENPDYNKSNMDRWGNFVRNSNIYSGSNYSPLEFPYTRQDENNLSGTNYSGQIPSNINVAPWTLKKIKMPGGGEINIDYESNDYAYVEDKKALRMFDIVGLGDDIDAYDYDLEPEGDYPFRKKSSTVTASTKKKSKNNLYYRIYFELEKPISGTYTNACNEFVSKYVGNISQLWYKTKMNIKTGTGDEKLDYVSGYCELESDKSNNDKFGVARYPGEISGDFKIGYVTVKPVEISEVNLTGEKIHPFRKAAIQHLLVNRPELVWGVQNINGNGLTALKNLVTGTASILTDLLKTVTGFNLYAVGKGWATDVHMNGHSIIRLQDPNGKKFGGGFRVKKIQIKDNWNKDNYADATYGFEYDYRIVEKADTISSGVVYEPQIGGEESALRNVISYTESTPLSSTRSLFLETPLLDECYPSSSIGYRKVTVKSIGKKQAVNDGNSITTSAAPVSVHEFYTPKDFPVLFDYTDMSADPAIVRPTYIPGIYSSYKKKLARSQGYSIILNDMSGKPKSLTRYTYPNDITKPLSNIISKEEYTYYTESDYKEGSVNRLTSKVPIITSDGSYEEGIMGQSHDIFIDINENAISSHSLGLDGNLDFTVAFPPLPLVPTAFPHEDESETSLRTIVTQKVIYRTGILKEITSTKYESLIKQQYLAFSESTGEPLLTKTYNEFRDPIYTYTLPANWYYDGMAEMFKRINIENVVTGMNNNHIVVTVSNFIKEGDYVAVVKSGTTSLGYVEEVVSGNNILVKNFKSVIISASPGDFVKIIKPANHNKLTTDAGKVVFKTLSNFDPINFSYTSFSIDDIIDASATEYADIWQGPCVGCGEICTTVDCATLDYNLGKKGIWRQKRDHVYETERDYSSSTVKVDGTYTDYSMFNWITPSSSSAKWITKDVITEYSPLGVPIESIDAIGNFSAAQYGYSMFYGAAYPGTMFNDALLKANGVNTRYNEMFFEGYESNDIFCLTGNLPTPSNTYAHTGKKSLPINPSSSSNLEMEIFEHCNKDMLPFYEISGTACECIPSFAPLADKKYMLSAWTKEVQSGIPYNFANARISIEYDDGFGWQTISSLYTSGYIIEGWQKIEGSFYIPAGATSIKIKLENVSGTNTVYYDDLRVHPFDANMKSYVYNMDTYKISAELDNNNYATFYIYDEEGKLTKMKKETTEGIKTFMESRMAFEITNP